MGVVWGLGGGNAIGCPPVARFGTPEQRRRWLPHVARGDLRFCLGITEPDGGLFGHCRDDTEYGANLSHIQLGRMLQISRLLRHEREITTL